LHILEQVRAGRPFERALDGNVGALAEPDRRLAHELAAGVLRQRNRLDRRLAPLVSRRWTKVAPQLQDILRLGAYQLTELDRVPPHAAVDTSVSLARDTQGSRAAGFVNAVLRQLSRSNDRPGTAAPRDPESLASDYSHPEWLVRRWVEHFGPAATARLLDWNNTRPRLTAQPARTDLQTLAARWKVAGIGVEAAPYDAGLLVDRSRPEELSGYEAGDFLIQNPAQALLARYADIDPGITLFDACAAPGGKTLTAGRRAGRIIAADISAARAARLRANVQRAGSGREQVIVADARHPPLRTVGALLLDVPCLGTGTFARHPDARWRVSAQALAALAGLQAELLDASAELIPPGGLLVYSTCSLEPEENEEQVERFLTRHPEFQREPSDRVPPELLSPVGDLMILPQTHGIDGAYAARLRRRA
jgi:16S rRNA (cytosine967-C5)-methyltransferase